MLSLEGRSEPVITTESLVLRELRHSDAPAVFAMRSDPETMRYVPRPVMKSMEEAEAHTTMVLATLEAGEGLQWAMTVKGNDTLIGIIGFWRMKLEHHRAELGYMLHRAHWNKGYITEAIPAVCRAGFHTFGFHSIEAITDPRNVASNRVLERNGFVREGLFRENFLWEGEFQDSAVYSLLRPGP